MADACDHAVIAFQNDIHLPHPLVAEMAGRQTQIRCGHELQHLRAGEAFQERCEFATIGPDTIELNPCTAPGNPESRKCSFGVLAIRFSTPVRQGCNVETSNILSSSAT